MRTLVKMFASALFCVVGLAGCATPIATGPSAQRAIYQAEGDFAAVLPLAVAYDHLPDCAGNPAPCSTGPVRAKVNAAAKLAKAALDTAQSLVRANSATAQVTAAVAEAQQDVAAFAALAGALGK